jgi:hypothetical protein
MKKILYTLEDGNLMFFCPGCGCGHKVWVKEGERVRWAWNGDLERPTFTPSIRVRSTELTERGKADCEAWRAAGCPTRNGVDFESRPTVCHSFVTAGRIQFLSDCTHAMAGRTVDLEPF